MKIQSAIFVLAFVATAANAEHAYKGLAEGHPDLTETHPQAEAPANLQARTAGTDEFDMHHGLSQGNTDLSPPPYAPDASAQRSDASGGFDFHHGLSNPDLSPPPPQR
jgi:hypothetical protein